MSGLVHKLARLLLYDRKREGPIGYKTRIGVIAMLPIAPFAFFLDGQSLSPIEEGLFWAAVLWGAGIFIVGVRELFSSVWKKNG